MAYEVSRRSFLKGAGALAAATAASGLLTACGGGKNDAGVVVGDYKVYFEGVKSGSETLKESTVYYIEPTVRIKRIEGNGWRSIHYEDAFTSAKVKDQALELSNKNESFGPLDKKQEALCKPRFTTKDEAVCKSAANGELVYFTIVLSKKEALFETNLKTGSVKLVVIK